MAFRSYEDHIADVLVANGLVRYVSPGVDWCVTIGRTNDIPNRQVTVYQTGGKAKNPKWLLEYPSMQLKVRGAPNDYQLVREKAELYFGWLVGKESYTAANGDRIVHINAVGDVAFLGWDDSKRPEFVFSLQLITEPALINRPGTNREPL